MFKPHDVVLKDDAFHKKAQVETWYYDALFDNGYSVVALVNVIHIWSIGVVLTGLYVYKDAKLVASLRRKTSYRHFYGSEEELLLRVNNREVVKGFFDKGRCTYRVCMGNSSLGVDLELIKASKAWKGKTFLGDWLVIPRFNVVGRIFLNGEKIDVSGEGYHDHNIYPFYAPFFIKGYHFGKIPADNLNVTWARVMGKREQRIVVLNTGENYVSANPEEVCFTVKSEVSDHGKEVPTVWCLKVEGDLLYLDVEVESIGFHHLGIPLVDYWRHHVRNKGILETDSVSKKICNVEISEYLRFL
jgi:hypothetical protein